jgi:hypothetical protein
VGIRPCVEDAGDETAEETPEGALWGVEEAEEEGVSIDEFADLDDDAGLS